jgi:hypothetical protein
MNSSKHLTFAMASSSVQDTFLLSVIVVIAGTLIIAERTTGGKAILMRALLT